MTTSQEAREYPPLPEPFMHVHELLNNGGGVWLGCQSLDAVQKAHDPGETGEVIHSLYSAAQVYDCIDADRKARQQEALDARRLEWLDRNRASIWTQWTNHAIGVPPTFHGFSVSADDKPLPTVRAAIDAAIAKGERHE